MQNMTDVHLFIEIAVMQETYECLFHRYSSLDDSLQLLASALPEDSFHPDDETMVIEKQTGRICDRWISPAKQGICDGMTLTVY